jgi:hypothetical protein
MPPKKPGLSELEQFQMPASTTLTSAQMILKTKGTLSSSSNLQPSRGAVRCQGFTAWSSSRRLGQTNRLSGEVPIAAGSQ